MNKVRSQKGFTLVELIIYLAIVSILLVSVSYLIIDMIGGQTKGYAKQEVNFNIRSITNDLSKTIRSAQAIGSLSGNTLVLTMSGDDITYNFDGVNNKLTKQIGAGSLIDINTNLVDVVGGFSDSSYLARSENVGIVLEVIYKNPGNLPDYNASTTVDFSVEVRGRK